MPVSAALRVELFGGFRLPGGAPPGTRLPGTRQQQLLTFLILEARDAPVPRQRCAGTLWPDSTNAQALTNLRRELHHLREAWPALDALVHVGSRTLAWHVGSNTGVDVLDFEAAADQGLAGDRAALEDAARRYRGDLLPDCDADWIVPERTRLRQRARVVLMRLVEDLERDQGFGEAIEHAEHLCRLDPLDEDAWRALMRCHARRGSRAAALHAYQECAALLRKELGVGPSGATRATYREVLDLDDAAPVTDPGPARPSAYPLCGRDRERRILLGAWRDADRSAPRLVLIRGESGIGKTRLAEELVEWCGHHAIGTSTVRCYAGDGRLAYAPIAAWLRSPALRPVLRHLDPGALSDVARLLPDVIAVRPDVRAPEVSLERWQRSRFFEALASAIRSACPIVLVVDDLHCADADTIDWLQFFLRSAASSRCLVVATVRAEEEGDNPALGRLLGDLEHHDRLTTITLGPLDEAATAELISAVAGVRFAPDDLARTYRETEGHPLFIVERGRSGEAGVPRGESATVRVQSLVAARLNLLSAEARAAVDVAAAVGRDFRFETLFGSGDLEEGALVRALDELWRRHVLRVRDDERWDFTHERTREIIYAGLGPARTRLIHRRIAQALELQHAAHLDEVSATIASHLSRGGQTSRAVVFLARAADAASRVLAHEEALHCLGDALDLLARLPAGLERDERELALRSSQSVVLNAARGYAAPEVEENLERVFALSRSTGRGRVPAQWLWAAFALRFVLGDVQGARHAAAEVLACSEVDPAYRCEAHHAMAATALSLGDFAASKRHFEAALDAYDAQPPRRSALGSDLGVFTRAWFAQTLWHLGEDEAAVTRAEQAVLLARRVDDRYSEALALAYAGLVHQLRRDPAGVEECASGVIALCGRHGFAYYDDWARVLLGWTRGQTQPGVGIPLIEAALGRLDVSRALARRPYHLSLLAETYVLAGRRDQATACLATAIAMAHERSDVWWLPELYRQRSTLEAPPVRAATRQVALELARAQGNVALERRIQAPRARSPA